MTETTSSQTENQNPLTSNMEDYIETISILSRHNKVVRVKDIAKKLGIKMPSVTAALIKLKEKKLITYEKYGYVELTESGATEANRIYDRHSLLASVLNEILGLDKVSADNEACRLEHHMTEETFSKFSALYNFYKSENDSNAQWVAKLKKATR